MNQELESVHAMAAGAYLSGYNKWVTADPIIISAKRLQYIGGEFIGFLGGLGTSRNTVRAKSKLWTLHEPDAVRGSVRARARRYAEITERRKTGTDSREQIGRARSEIITQATIDCVRQGLQLLREEDTLFGIQSDLPSRINEIDDDHIRAFILRQLDFTMLAVSDLARFSGNNSLSISDGPGFANFVDVNLQRRIEVPVRKFARFSTQLYEDMISFLAMGGRFEGPWGKIEISETGIKLHTEAPPFILPELGRRAIVLP